MNFRRKQQLGKDPPKIQKVTEKEARRIAYKLSDLFIRKGESHTVEEMMYYTSAYNRSHLGVGVHYLLKNYGIRLARMPNDKFRCVAVRKAKRTRRPPVKKTSNLEIISTFYLYQKIGEALGAVLFVLIILYCLMR